MKSIPENDPVAMEVVKAIKEGNTNQIKQLLELFPDLSRKGIKSSDGTIRSLLHIATDWPGHFPQVTQTIKLLTGAGADPNQGISGPDTETPLHWAASSNDVGAIDALLDAGADTDARGAVIAGGDPLEDAIGFQNWDAARRLVERGAKTKLGDESALGLMDRIEKRFQSGEEPGSRNISYSFWNACCSGEIKAAKFLLAKGADINWIPEWCDDSPMDSAVKAQNTELIDWLISQGAVKNSASR